MIKLAKHNIHTLTVSQVFHGHSVSYLGIFIEKGAGVEAHDEGAPMAAVDMKWYR